MIFAHALSVLFSPQIVVYKQDNGPGGISLDSTNVERFCRWKFLPEGIYTCFFAAAVSLACVQIVFQ